jgi:phosphoribosyl 1,2-cyclic phosphodiesterase
LLRFAAIGSGSEGNGLLVQSGNTTVMVDCGFTLAETEARLTRHGLTAGALSAILVTHEHGDHIDGVARLARKYSLPVYLSRGSAFHLGEVEPELIHYIDPHTAFEIDALQVQPFPVPHDAREPIHFVFSDGDLRLGCLTDIGCVTPHVVAVLSGVEALVLECNHDESMLANGPYPASLKSRVGGRLGHLSNRQSGELLAALDQRRLRHVLAAHLSKTNNREALATAALAQALGCASHWVGVATQDEGFGWRVV